MFKLSADTIPITTDTSSVSSKSSKKEPNSKNEVIGKYHVGFANNMFYLSKKGICLYLQIFYLNLFIDIVYL